MQIRCKNQNKMKKLSIFPTNRSVEGLETVPEEIIEKTKFVLQSACKFEVAQYFFNKLPTHRLFLSNQGFNKNDNYN
jgi:hypothetical protein